MQAESCTATGRTESSACDMGRCPVHPTCDAADLLGRRAGHHGVAGDRLEDQGAGRHHGTLAYGDVAQDCGSRAYEHVVADLRVPVAIPLPSTCGNLRPAVSDLHTRVITMLHLFASTVQHCMAGHVDASLSTAKHCQRSAPPFSSFPDVSP